MGEWGLHSVELLLVEIINRRIHPTPPHPHPPCVCCNVSFSYDFGQTGSNYDAREAVENLIFKASQGTFCVNKQVASFDGIKL